MYHSKGIQSFAKQSVGVGMFSTFSQSCCIAQNAIVFSDVYLQFSGRQNNLLA